MATVAAPRAISVSEALLRREAVASAVADLRLEGLAPTARVLSLLDRYIQGELTEEELISSVIAR